MHAVAPLDEEYEPAAHMVKLVRPADGHVVPARHVVHVDDPLREL